MSTRRITPSRHLLRNLSIFSLSIVLLYGISRVIPHAPATGTSTLATPATDISTATPQGKQIAVFAGGCFWGMEAVFEHLKGVSNVVAGFSGGDATTANYAIVSSGLTNHAESVEITYDPSQISYSQLLKVYFLAAHDPTQLNRQGPDTGKQYRSAIFFANDTQKQLAQEYIAQLNKSKIFDKQIVTQLAPLKGFYQAEAYHQHYVAHNPNDLYVLVNDLPKLTKLQEKFPDIYKK